MRVLIAGVAVVWTLLLGAIALQLYQVNDSLSWLSAPWRNLATSTTRTASEHKHETREQRIERKVREQREIVDEDAEIIKRLLIRDPPSKAATARPSRR